jgi:hypothetical protein
MRFDNAENVQMVVQQIREADYPRGKNRERINALFDGFPPMDEQFAEQNNVKINVNFLEGTVLAHDARAQFYNAFLKPGQYFTAQTDMGPDHKRGTYSQVVTQQVNKIMKRSPIYFETFRSKFALNVLHGIGPATWKDRDMWCPDAAAIADIGIPANTLLTMQNLPFFYIYRSFTGPELIRLTRGPKRDRGWNMDLVNSCVRWIDREMMLLMGSNWPEIWSPEKSQQRIKGDGGWYAGDECPTVDCFDFYFWNEEDSGWNRRIILDSWSSPLSQGSPKPRFTTARGQQFGRDQFLFNPGTRKYADKWSELVSFQFADLSSVAPFQYHSVRSLGFLLYAVCNLQNRMRCKFSEAVFEALMNYYRVKTMDDVERALKVDLINHGFVDETVEFIKAQDRWQPNVELIAMGMADNAQIINRNSSSYTQQPGGNAQKKERKTQFEVMAEIQQTTALVQSAFNQAYKYQEFEYREIFRRFCNDDSKDPDVREFRKACFMRDVPAEILVPEAWELTPTQIMGAGNQTVQAQIAQQLLQVRNLLDPEPQRESLRDYLFLITGDADRAERWAPDQPVKISDSVHDAQVSFGTLMAGYPVVPKTGQNHKEYVQVYLTQLSQAVGQIEQTTKMAPPDKIKGFQNVATAIAAHLQIMAQDPENKAFVAAIQKQLSKIVNLVRAFAQRLQEMQQKAAQQNGNGQVDPATIGKLKAQQLSAQVKAKNSRDSHAQKSAQRQVDFEAEQRRKDMETTAQIRRDNVATAHEINRNNMRSLNDDSGGDNE